MVRAGAVFAVALHPDLAGSRGTRDCVRRCLDAGIPVWHYAHEEQEEPARVLWLPGR